MSTTSGLPTMAEIDQRAREIGQRERTSKPVHVRRVNPATLQSARQGPSSPRRVPIPDCEVTTPVRPPPKVASLSPSGDGKRRYHPKPCEECGETFQPTGPRHRFCVACRPGRSRVVAAPSVVTLAERVADLERRVETLQGS